MIMRLGGLNDEVRADAFGGPAACAATNATKGVWAFGIAALFAVASSPAFAADVPIRGPARTALYDANPCYNCNYYYNWTGFYIGANVGAAWERSTLTDNFFNVSFSNDRSGFIAGGQIGYNWQLSPQFVVGVEWMFDGTDLKSDTTTVVGPAVIRTSAKVDWITTLAARFGWAANNWLFYGKAGGAWVHDGTNPDGDDTRCRHVFRQCFRQPKRVARRRGH